MNNILYKESELETLITNFENEKNKIAIFELFYI